MTPLPRWAFLLLALSSISACGGGGGSSTSSSTSSSSSSSSSGASTNTYTVSVTVSGLSGTGLVLELNTADDLSVSANGTVTFSSALATGAAYTVSVKTQPTNQPCAVNNGSGNIGTANITGVTVSCSSTPDLSAGGTNIIGVTVGTGPTSASSNVNIPYVSVTVCTHGTTKCATIDHVLLDTGSTGLRLFASVLPSTVTLTNETDANSRPIGECMGFADGYTWGPVATADITISGETASGAPLQIIDDNSSTAVPLRLAPSSCTTQGGGTSLNSITNFDANGVLGVAPFAQDCGSACATTLYPIYYSCNTGSGSCVETRLVVGSQVVNPVTMFSSDNNGVIVQLPSIAAAGATTATGYLAFGIGTRSNNFLGNATVLTADANGDIITTFNGQTLTESFIDTGSNAFYFTDSAITACSGSLSDFYCPASTLSLSATNQGQNGQTKTAAFNIANLNNLSGNNSAVDDIGGTLSNSTTLISNNTFDWGLPFFYGRTVYVAIEAASAGGSTGPYFAY